MSFRSLIGDIGRVVRDVRAHGLSQRAWHDLTMVCVGVTIGMLPLVVMMLCALRPWSGGAGEGRVVELDPVVAPVATDDGSSLVTVRDVVGDDAAGSPDGAVSADDGLVGWDLQPFGSYVVSLPEGLASHGVWYDDDARLLRQGAHESGAGRAEDRVVMRFYGEGAIGRYGIDRDLVRRAWSLASGRAAAVVDGSGGMRSVVVEDGDSDIVISYAAPYDDVSDADGSWGDAICSVCDCGFDEASDAMDDLMVGVVERTWGT